MALFLALMLKASMAANLIPFPEDYAKGVRYAVIDRGGIHEEIYTSQAAIEGARKNGELPDGSVITMVDTRGGKLYRYVVMEKRRGAGAQFPESIRNGDWTYQTFDANRQVNRSEDSARCMSCHKSQADNDYIQTMDQLRSARTTGGPHR